MNRMFESVTSAAKFFIAIVLWLLSLLASKSIKILTALDNALRNRTLCRSFPEDNPIGNVYYNIKIFVFSPRGTIRMVAEKVSGQSVTRQLEEGLAPVEQRGQNHDQRIHKPESTIGINRSCHCHEGPIEKRKVREVRKEEEEVEEALEALHQGPETADLGMMKPVEGLGDPPPSILDSNPPGIWVGKKYRGEVGSAESVESLERQKGTQRIALPRPNPVAIDSSPSGEVTRMHGSFMQRSLDLGREPAGARSTEEARNAQASRDREQAHYMEQSHSTGLPKPLKAVEDQAPGRSGQPLSGGRSRAPQVQSNSLQRHYEELRYPLGRVYPSDHRRKR